MVVPFPMHTIQAWAHFIFLIIVSLGSLSHNVQFKNIDGIDDNSGSFATNTDCDLLSNNDSYSSESQDQKDKKGTSKSENPLA